MALTDTRDNFVSRSNDDIDKPDPKGLFPLTEVQEDPHDVK